jgi:hypothetical protein
MTFSNLRHVKKAVFSYIWSHFASKSEKGLRENERKGSRENVALIGQMSSNFMT